jgi:DNA-binding SARP family transcriptional activator
MRLGLLGGFELELDGSPVRLPLHAQRLVAFLALQGRPLHRGYVAGRLRAELSQDRAQSCLRSTLWRMRQLPCAPVETSTTHLGLAGIVEVDARELERCADRVLREVSPRSPDLKPLTGAADLLPDWYDDWVLQERERLRQLRLLALEAAGEALIAAGAYGEAAVAALAAVSADPLRERACRLLVEAYLEDGNAGEALRQFARFRMELHRTLGLEPSARMQELIGTIKTA